MEWHSLLLHRMMSNMPKKLPLVVTDTVLVIATLYYSSTFSLSLSPILFYILPHINNGPITK